jgi:hypothetical protein
MATSTFRSPDDMLEEGKKIMLQGREPKSQRDWYLLMNFLAGNVHHSVALSACQLLAHIYEMPITDAEVEAIVNFQLQERAKMN